VKVPADVARFPDGEPILVVRPSNPPVVLSLAEIAVKHQSVEALRQTTEGPFKFMGFLVQRGSKWLAVDENGKNAKEVQPGDVFTSQQECEKLE
jgi:hypothetical protein